MFRENIGAPCGTHKRTTWKQQSYSFTKTVRIACCCCWNPQYRWLPQKACHIQWGLVTLLYVCLIPRRDTKSSFPPPPCLILGLIFEQGQEMNYSFDFVFIAILPRSESSFVDPSPPPFRTFFHSHNSTQTTFSTSRRGTSQKRWTDSADSS